MASFAAALAEGADGIELDVRSTADGHAMVIHDATLRRTHGVATRVSAATADELRGSPQPRRWHRFGCETALLAVPSLQDLFDFAARALIYVELKTTSRSDPITRIVCDLIARYESWRDTIVISFDHAAIARVRELDARIRTHASFAPRLGAVRPQPSRVVKRVLEVGASGAALHWTLATRREIDALACEGLSVVVWTVNGAVTARRVTGLGVDAILTDVPARLRDWIDSVAPV
jgi:glycerophosphoryl diester phosphodiesterase